MKKLLSILLCLIALCCTTCASAEQRLEFPEAHMTVTLDDSWVCITRETESIDFSGTLYNYEEVYQAVDTVKELMAHPDYQNLYAYFFKCDETYYSEVHILTYETPETNDVWDFSLVPNISTAVGDDVIEQYRSSHNDLYACFDISSVYGTEYGTCLSYLTVNNGIGIRIDYLVDSTTTIPAAYSEAHKLLDCIEFTEKAPKPASSNQPQSHGGSTEAKQDKSRQFLSSAFDVIKKGFLWFVYDFLQMTDTSIIIWGALIIISAIAGIVKFIFRR